MNCSSVRFAFSSNCVINTTLSASHTFFHPWVAYGISYNTLIWCGSHLIPPCPQRTIEMLLLELLTSTANSPRGGHMVLIMRHGKPEISHCSRYTVFTVFFSPSNNSWQWSQIKHIIYSNLVFLTIIVLCHIHWMCPKSWDLIFFFNFICLFWILLLWWCVNHRFNVIWWEACRGFCNCICSMYMHLPLEGLYE